MAQRIHLVAAARPNFMKVAPLWHALAAAPDFDPVLIHTGQHYDVNMSDAFFTDLRLPEPDHHLGVGSGSHAEQTGGVMIAYERVALGDRPDWLVVVGDVNSTAACTLVAAKLCFPVVHLEAGLRSGDRAMPEEINRLMTDVLADVLWTPSLDADDNLRAEGIAVERVTRVGNIMLDSFELVRPAIEGADVPGELGLTRGRYGVVTLHRPSNVDEPAQLIRLADALIELQRDLPLVFPVHPRTAARLRQNGLDGRLERSGVRLIAPQSYVRFMSLVGGAAAAITDSGGLQEETTYLGIPCLTLRENTERPITISEGTNRLVTPETLGLELSRALSTPRAVRARPELWDGATAGRCLADLRRRSGPARLPSAVEDPQARVAALARTYSGEERRASTAGSSYRRSS
ncbi:non-hydrolyzing UDP-N-acetylglucosamine 2-epimerase [Sphingosinicella sp. BN140058]|uniref:non-hydrolyzing UDP-N-acetylglucosamine 2-epimerase n=1 Tax=Sphingosinicella sp. BN140058 TaxID=1892855 RepID=UPI0010137C39|nr:UDP-N-acetylglucosamine 2-epimerase (non-hydrolyzing) [Sphingosinicella sp. BN140058]QAY75234.1 UDP-N-acetylglucosamine 2-epimerase (non-hydrolyzing) [Sphingosinicella sp. BN140058]